jgi:hypothetical protein
MRSCAVTLSRTELATISRSARRITEEVLAPVEIVRSEIRDGFRTLASSRNLTSPDYSDSLAGAVCDYLENYMLIKDRS